MDLLITIGCVFVYIFFSSGRDGLTSRCVPPERPILGLLLQALLVEVAFLELKLSAGGASPLTLLVVSGVALGRATVLEYHVVVVLVFVDSAHNAGHGWLGGKRTSSGSGAGRGVEDNFLWIGRVGRLL